MRPDPLVGPARALLCRKCYFAPQPTRCLARLLLLLLALSLAPPLLASSPVLCDPQPAPDTPRAAHFRRRPTSGPRRPIDGSAAIRSMTDPKLRPHRRPAAPFGRVLIADSGANNKLIARARLCLLSRTLGPAFVDAATGWRFRRALCWRGAICSSPLATNNISAADNNNGRADKNRSDHH